MENNAFVRSNPTGGKKTVGSSAPVIRAEPVCVPRPVLTGTLRTAAVPPERAAAAVGSSHPATAQQQPLAAAFAQAEARRSAADPAVLPDLTDAFAQAEAQRLAALDTANREPDCTDEIPDRDALYAALQRGTGWGKDAGGTLTLTSAASMLLDWGEDNCAARLELQPLTEVIRTWLETLDCCLQEHFRENWPNISAFGDRMVANVAPYADRLTDAGSPNRRTDYSPVHWAAVKEAVEQAVNGVGF